jgi:hypothetical protein
MHQGLSLPFSFPHDAGARYDAAVRMPLRRR